MSALTLWQHEEMITSSLAGGDHLFVFGFDDGCADGGLQCVGKAQLQQSVLHRGEVHQRKFRDKRGRHTGDDLFAGGDHLFTRGTSSRICFASWGQFTKQRPHRMHSSG